MWNSWGNLTVPPASKEAVSPSKLLGRVVVLYFMSREFAAFRLIFYNGNRNDMLSVASNVSIASDDDQIQTHKRKWVTVLHTMIVF